MASFVLSFFPLDVLDEIWDLIESVSEGFRTYSSLDLSICFPTLLLNYDWKVHDDLCGSDHFPIFLNNIGPDIDEPVSRWKFNKANWAQFQTLCAHEFLKILCGRLMILLSL